MTGADTGRSEHALDKNSGTVGCLFGRPAHQSFSRGYQGGAVGYPSVLGIDPDPDGDLRPFGYGGHGERDGGLVLVFLFPDSPVRGGSGLFLHSAGDRSSRVADPQAVSVVLTLLRFSGDL